MGPRRTKGLLPSRLEERALSRREARLAFYGGGRPDEHRTPAFRVSGFGFKVQGSVRFRVEGFRHTLRARKSAAPHNSSVLSRSAMSTNSCITLPLKVGQCCMRPLPFARVLASQRQREINHTFAGDTQDTLQTMHLVKVCVSL